MMLWAQGFALKEIGNRVGSKTNIRFWKYWNTEKYQQSRRGTDAVEINKSKLPQRQSLISMLMALQQHAFLSTASHLDDGRNKGG